MTQTPRDVPLTPDQLDELKAFDTPTISNALELLGFRERDRNEGILSARIQSVFPHFPPMVGYAATLLFETRQPPRGKFQADREDYWRYVLSAPKPTVTVGQDIDPAPAGGSLWGEVQANIHRALGCVGVVLEGAIRDLDPLEALHYPAFAREIVVGHAWAHIVDYGLPVTVGDVLVHPGDLIHADRHGVLVIPREAASQVAAGCRAIIDAERPLIAVCQDAEHFSLERLSSAYRQFSKLYPTAKPQDP